MTPDGKYTMEDIKALSTTFITPMQAGQAAGMDAYAINVCGKTGRAWMGLTVYMSGRMGTRAHIDRIAFLKRFGAWESD